MSIVPDRPEPDLRHPDWCDPKRCTAFDERPDAVHRSAPTVVPTVQPSGEVRIEAWLSQLADEPVDGCEATLILSFADCGMGCLPYLFTVELELPKVLGLLSTLESLVATVRHRQATKARSYLDERSETW